MNAYEERGWTWKAFLRIIKEKHNINCYIVYGFMIFFGYTLFWDPALALFPSFSATDILSPRKGSIHGSVIPDFKQWQKVRLSNKQLGNQNADLSTCRSSPITESPLIL